MDKKNKRNLFISNPQKNDFFGVTNLRLDKYINEQKIYEQSLKSIDIDKHTDEKKRAIYEIIQDGISPFFTKIDISLLSSQTGIPKKELIDKFYNLDFTLTQARKIRELLIEQLLNNVNIYKVRTRVPGK